MTQQTDSDEKGLSRASDDAIDHPLFSRDPEIMHGRLCFRGTRIHVAAAQHYHDAGYSREEIMREYPDLTLEQIDAAIAAPREDD